MMGIGWQEIIVIFFVLLVFVGPKRLPEFAREFGKFLRKVARAKAEARHMIERELARAGVEVQKTYLEITDTGGFERDKFFQRNDEGDSDEKLSVNKPKGSSGQSAK